MLSWIFSEHTVEQEYEAQTEGLVPAYSFMFPRLNKDYPRFACLLNGFNLFSDKIIIIVSID